MATSSSDQKPKVLYISNQYAKVTEVLTKEKPSALRSIIAGSTAGAVEIGNVMPNHSSTSILITDDRCVCLTAITYPAECTYHFRSQLMLGVNRLLQAFILWGQALTGLSSTNPVAKTRTQLNRRLPDSKRLGWPSFGKAWYAGCTTLIIGNSLKAGIRASCHFSRRSASANRSGGCYDAMQVLWHSIPTRRCCKIRLDIYLGLGL